MYGGKAISCECVRGKMGVVGVVVCTHGAGRCVHKFMPIAGARAGWACAH